MELTITKFDNGKGIILPPDLLARLQLKDGDTLFVSETPDGIKLSARDADLSETLDIARQVMHEDRELLKKLAE